MPAHRLYSTFTFQVALLYLGLFGATVAALLGFIYWSTSDLLDSQMADTVDAEIRGLSEQYRNEGLGRLVEVIRERSGPWGDPANVYLLTDPALLPVAGNLEAWPEMPPAESGWREFVLRRVGDDGRTAHTIRARVFKLSNGFQLLVGRDTTQRGDFRRILAKGLTWAVLPTLLLGLLGGVLIGRYALHRVDAVRTTGEQIIKGDLSRRMPLSGSNDEFDRLSATINEMLDQIDMLMAGMRVVTDSLAHDLRSPLTRAKGVIEGTLRKQAGARAYRQALEQTNAELDTILRTFEALVNIAQADAGVNRLEMGPLDLSALVGDLAGLYEPIAEEAGLTLDARTGEAVQVTGHRQLLGQAIANLLDNAVKYTPAGGRIGIGLDLADGAPVLMVEDTGPGIPEAERHHVLERFVRLDGSRGTPGSGLGLSLVAAVARLHHARLELGDAEGGCAVGAGLRVAILFPPP